MVNALILPSQTACFLRGSGVRVVPISETGEPACCSVFAWVSFCFE